MPVGRSVGMTIGTLLLFAAIGIGLALAANSHLTDRREFLLQQVGPSLRNSIALEGALVNEETGVRGYVINAEPAFLEPYRDGLRDEAVAFNELHKREHATGPETTALIEAVFASTQDWRRRYVMPTLRLVAAHGAPHSGELGRRLFNQVRVGLSRLQSDLSRKSLATRAQLAHAADQLELILIVAGALIIGSVLLAGLFLRAMITRPLSKLGAEAGRVAAGEFTRPLALAAGPREIRDLGIEIETMRERIVQELSKVQAGSFKLASQSEELSRSNAELEQFAYVASHDLQEPLRKVASFCQALKSRYHGQLDARADQYIDFAVDGAERMQVLINALLALSRVGRGEEPHERIELDEVAAAASKSLAVEIEGTGARVLVGALPAVRGDRTLLMSIFQNMIGNAIKFRGSDPPVVRIDCQQREDDWLLSFVDNGIGIEPQYAERIFQIFQRLHTREAYEGTGIGLAMCRKIAEYHGGRIWLDREYTGGTRFQLTLPMVKEAT